MSQNPYNPYGANPNDPGANPGTSYGSNPNDQYTPTYPSSPPPPPGVNLNPYDPYAPTVPASGLNPTFNAYPPPPPLPPVLPPKPRGGLSGKILLLGALALLIVLGGIIFAIVSVPNQNAAQTAKANATATAQANSSATAVASTYPFSANLKLNDPLVDNSRGNGWETNNSCKFSGSAYHVSESQQNTYTPCTALNTKFSNFTFQVEMTIIKGDIGGLIFRADVTNAKFYRLIVNQDQSYILLVAVDTTGTNVRGLKSDTSQLINQGLDQTNLVAIVARGDSISFYVNKQLVTTVTDSTYSQGQIGVVAQDLTNPTEVVYSNAKVWQL